MMRREDTRGDMGGKAQHEQVLSKVDLQRNEEYETEGMGFRGMWQGRTEDRSGSNCFCVRRTCLERGEVRTVTLLTRARQVGFVLNRSPKHSSPWFEPKALDMMATV